jgi:formylglycine-generating enzyme required for sulfatase activity
VGNKDPNQFGLYDMLGNVYEWCWDLSGHYPNVDKKDWRGPESGSHLFKPNRRITPGGAWNSTAEKCTFDLRNHGYPDTSKEWLGFRLAMSL